MSGEITVKAPVAMLVLMVLVISLMVNVYKFAQPPQVVNIGGVGSTYRGGGAGATLPNGQPDPLAHIPSGPRDAVGMPDATGGRGGQ